jgi:tetratricopeptide (TPR) repeat protein
MSSGYSSRRMTGTSSTPRGILVIISAICSVALLSSCSELEARRDIQKGDKLYEDGKYSEAIALYEKALDKSDLAIGHHNLAITAFAAFQPGIETPANMTYARKASEHFQAYLELKPNDSEIIELMTTVWLDSDQTDVALQYWEAERVKNPESLAPIRKLGTIQRLAGNYEEALKWDYARVELSTTPKDKVLALVQIGQLQYSRLAKSTMVDAERVAVADSGIAALQRALSLQPENAKLHSLIATIYQFRSLAHQAGWAQLADTASQRYHHIKRKALADAAKAKQAKESGADPSLNQEKKGESTKGSKE